MPRSSRSGMTSSGRAMVSYLGRVYVFTATLVIFCFAWAAVAAKPWVDTSPAKQDPRLTTLAKQEKQLRREATQVKHLVGRRWRVYQRRLGERKQQIAKARESYEQQLAVARAAEARIAAQRAAAAAAASVVSYSPAASSAQPVSSSAAAPSVRVVTLPPKVNVVTLPPVTTTKSS